jgi:hypothetical protein
MMRELMWEMRDVDCSRWICSMEEMEKHNDDDDLRRREQPPPYDRRASEGLGPGQARAWL